MRKHLAHAAVGLALGCAVLAAWALTAGTSPVLEVGNHTYWPWAWFAIIIGAVFSMYMRELSTPTVLHMFLSTHDTPVVAFLAALLTGMAAVSGYAQELSPGLAAAQLTALGLIAVGCAGLLLVPEAGVPAVPLLPFARTAAPLESPGPGRLLTFVARASSRWRGGIGAPVCQVTARVDPERLVAQRAMEHTLPPEAWRQAVLVTPEIGDLADQVRYISRTQAYDCVDEVLLVAGIVTEGLGPIVETDELQVSYPLETLTDGQTGITGRLVLATALLYALGYDVALMQSGSTRALRVTTPWPCSDLTLQVDGKAALFVSLSGEEPFVGDIPAQFLTMDWTIAALAD